MNDDNNHSREEAIDDDAFAARLSALAPAAAGVDDREMLFAAGYAKGQQDAALAPATSIHRATTALALAACAIIAIGSFVAGHRQGTSLATEQSESSAPIATLPEPSNLAISAPDPSSTIALHIPVANTESDPQEIFRSVKQVSIAPLRVRSTGFDWETFASATENSLPPRESLADFDAQSLTPRSHTHRQWN